MARRVEDYRGLTQVSRLRVLEEERLTVSLLRCLYCELIDEDQPLVCSVHAKLVRHQLEQVPGPLQLARMHPFAEENRCLLVLALAGQEPRTRRTGGVSADQDESALEKHAVAALRAHDG